MKSKGPNILPWGTPVWIVSNEEFTLYASHSEWSSKEDFINWTKSEAFRMAHKNAGGHKTVYLDHPQFEGFEVVI